MTELERQSKLMWHHLAVVYVWSVGGDVDDETAFVALTRIKQWVDEALGILEGETTSKER